MERKGDPHRITVAVTCIFSLHFYCSSHYYGYIYMSTQLARNIVDLDFMLCGILLSPRQRSCYRHISFFLLHQVPGIAQCEC